MFDLGWTELLLIGVVALIVVGPKDLPGMFHALGKFTARIRGMAREFQRAMEDAAKESGVKDVTKDLRKLGDISNPRKAGMNALKDATKDLTNWSPDKAVKAKDATKDSAAPPELSPERAEMAQKIRDNAASKATERLAAEAAAKEAPNPAPPKDDGPVTDPNAPKGRDEA